MRTTCATKAFSLTELLVALGILAIVGSVIVPRFLNIRNSASETAATAMATELNRVYGAWVATGGRINGENVATSDLIGVLTGALSASGTGGGSYSSISETPESRNVRVSAPEGMILPEILSSTVAYQQGYIAFDNHTQRFFVSTGRNLDSLTWKSSGSNSYTYSSGIGISGYIPVAIGSSYFMVPIKPSQPSTDGYTYASNEWKKVNYSSSDPVNGSFTVNVHTFDPESGGGVTISTNPDPGGGIMGPPNP